MDDQRDDFEILDFGPADDKLRDAAEADLPAMHGEAEPTAVIDLGENATAPPPTLPRWQRWAIMAAVFTAGLAFGGYGWHARSEAVDATRVNLAGVDIQGELFDDVEQSRLFAHIHNAGDRDVTIVDLRWPEAESPGDVQREIAIPSGETQGIVIRGRIDCESGRPEWLEADVATDVGLASVPVPITSGTMLDFLLSITCDGVDGLPVDEPGIFFAGNVAPAGGAPSRTVLGIDHVIGNAEIVEVTVAAPGFDATPMNLPIELWRGGGASLELDWAVTDCAATHNLGAVDVEFTFSDRSTALVPLPDWTIAQLARLAVAECGS